MIELMKSNGLGTFWARGRLSAMEQACLSSFVHRGYDVTLFSYGVIDGVPDGVRLDDARAFYPESMIDQVRYDGRPDLAHFSDIFRYEMIRQRDLVWFDTDLLMISDGDVPTQENIIVREEQGGINNALLYVADKRVIEAISAAAKAKLGQNLRWGETGPMVVKDAVERDMPQAALYDHSLFYPIEHYDIWKVLLPSYRDDCEDKARAAATLHLFNNIITTMGYWKDIAPPVGSFLHQRLKEADLLQFFSATYPEKVMTACVDNFRFRQNGKALGVRAILRELIPSIGRTYGHYWK